MGDGTDRIFQESPRGKFEFDEAVAAVFDDMLRRSIPLYSEVLQLSVELIDRLYPEAISVTDLGCSTAGFLLALAERRGARKEDRYVGVDNSHAMLERAARKCDAYGLKERIELVEGDLRSYPLRRQNLISAHYTLQFIRPMDRPGLVRRIYEGLEEGGSFLFSEKVVFDDRKLDKTMIDLYYDYKRRQGYSEYEIAHKREALENVLIPFTVEENRRLCLEAGFERVETLAQWGNFVTFLAGKAG